MPADPISVRTVLSLTAWIRRPAPPTGGRRGSLIRGSNERAVSKMQGKSRAREGAGLRDQGPRLCQAARKLPSIVEGFGPRR